MLNGNGQHGLDLAAIAVQELHKAGFQPEFSPEAAAQVRELSARSPEGKGGQDSHGSQGVEDLRERDWSSIDNDTSRDLDQIEVAERVPGGIRVHVAIADVAAMVAKDSAIDQHAAAQTQTVYTAVRNFPMLPLELSTDLTSLNENGDRRAVLMSFTVGEGGALADEAVTLATVRNRAQLAYSRVGPWLEAAAAGTAVAKVATLRSDSAPKGSAMSDQEDGALAEQLRLQDEAAQKLHKARVALGALEFHRAEADPVVLDGRIAGLHESVQNRAMNLVEDLMVAANGVMARALRRGGRSALQRVVRVPQRWDRIVALTSERGATLPATPDPVALNDFLQQQRASDPIHYPDLAVGVIKLLGAGEYVMMRADEDPAGHFGLAARDYAHSTAPNRRFPDLVMQRLLHAMVAGTASPYSDEELAAIATHCNDADKALRKIDRAMQKRVAAVAMSSHIGQVFNGVVTGVSSKGVYARVIEPPFDGRIVENEAGLDVGCRVKLKLLHTDPARAFIDFAEVSADCAGDAHAAERGHVEA